MDTPEDDLLRELASAPARAVEELARPRPRRGEVIDGRFEILGELGRGGFGVVYEAKDLELGRVVAFKTVRGKAAPPDREAEAAARLNHPNIVTLHDFRTSESGAYLILERLEGETLQQRLTHGRIGRREAVRIGLAIARGLQHAHERGVIHRDLKPGNVFLGADGAVKVLDFGLARIFGEEGPRSGTPAFMAPEQWEKGPADARIDVFALGVMLYGMLSGKLPYRVSRGKSAALEAGEAKPLPRTSAPAPLRRVIERAIDKDPARRPSLNELIDALSAPAGTRWRRALVPVALLLALGVIWLARAPRPAMRAAPPRPTSGAVAPDRVAIGYDTGEVALWENGGLRPLRAGRDPLISLQFSPGGEALLGASVDGQAYLWSSGSRRVLPGHTGPVVSARFGPDGRLVTASADGTARLWTRDGAPLGELQAGSAVLAAAFMPEGGVIAGSIDGGARIFGPGGELVRTVPAAEPVTAVAASADRIAIGALDGSVRLQTADGPPSLFFSGAQGVASVAFSPDGRQLLATFRGGFARLAPIAGGLPSVFRGNGGVIAAAFSADGSKALLLSRDGTVTIDGSATTHVLPADADFPAPADSPVLIRARHAGRGASFAEGAFLGARATVEDERLTARDRLVDRTLRNDRGSLTLQVERRFIAPGIVVGTWKVLHGTGAFASARGGGQHAGVVSEPRNAEEIFLGELH